MALERHDDHWVWVGGPVPPGSDAITVWRVISVRRRSADDTHLMRHEQEHLRQWSDLGVGRFLARYLGAYLRGRLHGYGHKDAYRLIPLEVEAEQAAVDADRAPSGEADRAPSGEADRGPGDITPPPVT